METGFRFYLVFSRGKALRFLSHLDMMRLWERVLRRSGLDLRYSQGYHPHPRLSLALPLAVGMTGDAEWLEIELSTELSGETICRRVAAQLPEGIRLCWVGEAPWKARPLAAQLRGGIYEVEIREPPEKQELHRRIHEFLAADCWLVQEQRKGRTRLRDLRTGVSELKIGAWKTGRGGYLYMELRHNVEGGAQPKGVLRALRLNGDAHCHRKRLLFRQGPQVPGKEVWCSDE
jgi:radical SAM-linked protein